MSNFKVQNNLLYKLKSHYLQLNDNDTPPPPLPRRPWKFRICCVGVLCCDEAVWRQDGAGRYRPALMWPWWIGAVISGFRLEVVSVCSSLALSPPPSFCMHEFLHDSDLFMR